MTLIYYASVSVGGLNGPMGDETVEARVLSDGVYDWRRMRPLGEPVVLSRLARLRSLIVVTLLSLGLWAAAIWAAVAIFASAT